MKLESILDKARSLKDEAAEFIRKEHTISLTNSRLSRYEKQIAQAMESKDIEDGSIRLHEGRIHVSGRFSKAGGGRLEAGLAPAGVIWEDSSHVLLFEIVSQNVTMDKKLANVMASSAARITGALFGADYLNKKIGIVDDQGRINVALDDHSPTIDAVVDSIEVSSLRMQNDRLLVSFRAKPRKALHNAKALMSWWKTRLLSKREE